MELENLKKLLVQQKFSLKKAERIYHSRFEKDSGKSQRYFDSFQTKNFNFNINTGESSKKAILKRKDVDRRDGKIKVELPKYRKNGIEKRKIDDKAKYRMPDNRRRRIRINLPDEESLKKPRKMPKLSPAMEKRNKMFMNHLKNHIKEAKKELKIERKSEKMRNREELTKRIDEAITKDREEFKDEYRRKKQEKARNFMLCKKFDLEETEWKIAKIMKTKIIKRLEEQSKLISKYIKTKTNPPIFYRAKNMNETLNKKLLESNKLNEEELEKEKKKILATIPEKPVASKSILEFKELLKAKFENFKVLKNGNENGETKLNSEEINAKK